MRFVDVVDVSISKLTFSRWFPLVRSRLFSKASLNHDFRGVSFSGDTQDHVFLGVSARKTAPFYKIGRKDFFFARYGANLWQNVKRFLRWYTLYY
jgi:hypothetical protein